MECCMCHGPLVVLGQLGSIVHFRCRNCGMDQSLPAADVDELVGTEEVEED